MPLLLQLGEMKIQFTVVHSQNLVVLLHPQTITSQILKPFEHIIVSTSPTTSLYPLASIDAKQSTVVKLGNVAIGQGHFAMMAGPCSIESEEQIESIAGFLASQGIKILRGGAYKPRTSPYSFRGLGKAGLQMMRKAADRHGMKVVTEILDISLLDEVLEYADMLQVGSRNMQNFYMLNELGKINKPILLKRGMQAKVKEWLLAAEYVLSGGNDNVVLCERGIRSFDNETRNVMDIGVIPLIKELSHLPIIADPSHGTGAASRVSALSMASVAAGAHGLLIEVHPQPEKALSDKHQAIDYFTFEKLNEQVKNVLRATHPESNILNTQTL
jgi:3-deoxy-7-phosphoheptulonate synthase